MIRRAAAELDLVVSRSYVVGDQLTDMELAARSGAKGIWLHEGGNASGETPAGVTRVVKDLWEAARWIVDVENDRPVNVRS